MIRASLVLAGSMLLWASVASGAAPLMMVEHGPTGWLRYGLVLQRVGFIGPTSEPVALLLLGVGFVLVAHQIRRRA